MLKYFFSTLLLCLQIRSVDDFVYSVNNHLTTRQETERLKGIMSRIDSYDVVVSVGLSLFFYSSLLLLKNYEKRMKISEENIKTCLRN
jgi:hypothetical protein